ncbi:Glycosyltransferase [uncultured virus]|nr:Glycosyltransferase [uncultured virus]
MNFTTLDSKAHASKKPSEKVAIYKDITLKAQTDPEFRKTINYERFMNSSRAFAHLLAKTPKTGLKIAILGYKVQLMGKWDPFDTIKGLPGSEECAVYASQELANRGHQVTVYLNPPDESIWKSPFANPRWMTEDMWGVSENRETYDIVLMWRRLDADTGRQRGKYVFFWPHDSPIKAPPGMNFPRFDGVCVLSDYHRRQHADLWPGFDKIPYTICGNGVVPSQFSKPMSFINPYSIGYFSNYARGLIVLMLIWPEIRKEFPEATLSICYGRETWGTMPPQQLQLVIDRIAQYKDLGVTEHGKVGHDELASIMQNTSVLAYPCIAAGETFCITLVKAQISGMIPVVNRIAALNETTHPEAPHTTEIKDNNDIFKYRDLLLSTLRRIRDSDPEEIRKERQKYIDFASKFSWKACVDKWLALYEQISK